MPCGPGSPCRPISPCGPVGPIGPGGPSGPICPPSALNARTANGTKPTENRGAISTSSPTISIPTYNSPPNNEGEIELVSPIDK
ncbi:MAG: hypothetical protein RKU31_40130 [Deltaproteobacteria bacterium]